MEDGEKGYRGLNSEEVQKRIDAGQVNISENHISKTTGEIIRCHTLTYFNFLNIFLRYLCYQKQRAGCALLNKR